MRDRQFLAVPDYASPLAGLRSIRATDINSIRVPPLPPRSARSSSSSAADRLRPLLQSASHLGNQDGSVVGQPETLARPDLDPVGGRGLLRPLLLGRPHPAQSHNR